jgi:hypothetical protein
MEKVDANSVFSQLKTTLSKLYPIEHWTMSTKAEASYPFAPRFCWTFFRPDPEALDRISEAIQQYRGDIGWVFGPSSPNATTCLVATKRGSDQFVGYAPISRGLKEALEPSEEFIAQALSDIPSLCSHVEQYLRLDHLAPKSFDPRIVAPPDPPSADMVPPDFVEGGMHVAWIIYGDPREDEEDGPKQRRMLHFSITEKEWREIRADTLKNVSSTNEATPPLFPLLSRIEETESAYFRKAEVRALRGECLRARALTSEPLEIRGLDKLILLCNWAQHGAGDLLLRAP